MPPAVVAGITAATALVSGVATIASGTGGGRPQSPEPFPLNSDQKTVAGQLANSFTSYSQGGNPVTGKPTLGQGLTGNINSPQSLRDRLNSVGADLNNLVGPRTPPPTPV